MCGLLLGATFCVQWASLRGESRGENQENGGKQRGKITKWGKAKENGENRRKWGKAETVVSVIGCVCECEWDVRVTRAQLFRCLCAPAAQVACKIHCKRAAPRERAAPEDSQLQSQFNSNSNSNFDFDHCSTTIETGQFQFHFFAQRTEQKRAKVCATCSPLVYFAA